MQPIPLAVKALKTTGGVVRCLGPGKEHTFRSPDRVGVRVCQKCREKINSAPAACLSKVMTDPTT